MSARDEQDRDASVAGFALKRPYTIVAAMMLVCLLALVHAFALGGVAIAGTGPSAEVTARWNGTVTAHFSYYNPVETVTLAWSPSTCGETLLNGTVYSSPGPATAQLRDAGNYSLEAISCGGYSF